MPSHCTSESTALLSRAPGRAPAGRLLAHGGADGERAVAAEAERIAGLLGGDGVTASFPTPLYRELHA